MKLPWRPSLSPRRPARQAGHSRGSPPSAGTGKKCEPRSLSSASMTSEILRSRVCSTALENCVPERLHDPAPVGPPAGDVVELLLERGGEAGVDVALEEAGQEGGDQPAAVLGDEALVLHADVVAVAQHGQDAGVGAGAADAELLHLLDQAGFRVARRRLGEVLVGADRGRARSGRARASAAACGCRRPAPSGAVVDVLAIELEEAVEGDDRAGGAQLGAAARRGRRRPGRARPTASGWRRRASRPARRAGAARRRGSARPAPACG